MQSPTIAAIRGLLVVIFLLFFSTTLPAQVKINERVEINSDESPLAPSLTLDYPATLNICSIGMCIGDIKVILNYGGTIDSTVFHQLDPVTGEPTYNTYYKVENIPAGTVLTFTYGMEGETATYPIGISEIESTECSGWWQLEGTDISLPIALYLQAGRTTPLLPYHLSFDFSSSLSLMYTDSQFVPIHLLDCCGYSQTPAPVVYRVEITQGKEWCSLYDPANGARGTTIDSLNSPDGWSSFYIEAIGEEPSEPQQGSLTVSSYGDVVPPLTLNFLITPYRRTLQVTPGRKDIIYGDTTQLTLTMIGASGNPSGEELLDAQYSIIRGNAYSTLQSLDSTVIGDTIDGVFPSAILRTMDDVNAPDSSSILIKVVATAPCPECGGASSIVAPKDSSKNGGRDIAGIRKELLSQRLKRMTPTALMKLQYAIQMKSNENPPHTRGSLKTLDNVIPLSQTTKSSSSHLNKIQYDGYTKNYYGLTKVTVRKPVITLNVESTTLVPLGDSDNKGPKNARVIDFSKVKKTMVTVTAKGDDGKPAPDYPFTLTAFVRENSGGHDHTTNRPTGRFINKNNDTVATFSDKTKSDGTAKYPYLCSGFGGVDSLYAKGKTDKDTSTAIILLKMGDFVELTDGGHYVLIGANAGGSLHSKNHYGKTTLINVLNELADTTYSEKSYKLRFNDMSLITGGPFDFHNDWNCPHQNHREGVSADVSSTAVADDGSNRSITEKQLHEWFQELTQDFTYSIENEVQSACHYHVTVR